MQNRVRLSTWALTVAIGLGIVQMLDIFIHNATNQLEPLRVISNVLILIWVALLASGRISPRAVGTAVAFVGGYLLLNLYFVATQGTINPNTGDPRTALFILVALTVVGSVVLVTQKRTALPGS